MHSNFSNEYNENVYFHCIKWVSDSIADLSALSNFDGDQDVSCLGFFGRGICVKSMINVGWVLSTLGCQFLLNK